MLNGTRTMPAAPQRALEFSPPHARARPLSKQHLRASGGEGGGVGRKTWHTAGWSVGEAIIDAKCLELQGNNLSLGIVGFTVPAREYCLHQDWSAGHSARNCRWESWTSRWPTYALRVVEASLYVRFVCMRRRGRRAVMDDASKGHDTAGRGGSLLTNANVAVNDRIRPRGATLFNSQ